MKRWVYLMYTFTSIKRKQCKDDEMYKTSLQNIQNIHNFKVSKHTCQSK